MAGLEIHLTDEIFKLQSVFWVISQRINLRVSGSELLFKGSALFKFFKHVFWIIEKKNVLHIMDFQKD